MPKTILMIGQPASRQNRDLPRLAKLAGAPFIKVEATKFTEVGYVGRDVEQIVRDLVEAGIALIRDRKREDVKAKAHINAEERVLDALVGKTVQPGHARKLPQKLRDGELDEKDIVGRIRRHGHAAIRDSRNAGSQYRYDQPSDMLGKAMGGRTKTTSDSVKKSYDFLINDESDKLIDIGSDQPRGRAGGRG